LLLEIYCRFIAPVVGLVKGYNKYVAFVIDYAKVQELLAPQNTNIFKMKNDDKSFEKFA